MKTRLHAWLLVPLAWLLTGQACEAANAAGAPNAASSESIARGQAYFTTCAGCHGTQAQGNSGMHAPNLTVQGPSYLLTQLQHFAHDVRGGPTDFYGWQMNGRAKALPDDLALRDVIAFIGTLPKFRASPSVKGDLSRGRELYAACASCHGAHAEGRSATPKDRVPSAPALAGLDDYYQLAQLKAFRTGARGSHKDDAQGSIMRAAAAGIPSDTAAQDVVAYIATLSH